MVADPNCIFCNIVSGRIPCSKVFENADVLAFLDIGPVRPGHALVIPKAHHPTLFDLPPASGQSLIAAMQAVGRAILEATGDAGLNVQMNVFETAGQLVPHAHFHLIPRRAGDGIDLWPQKKYASMDEMNALAAAIRDRVKL